MTIRALRSQHEHAVYMARIYRTRGWKKAVDKLCAEIMRRSRPVKASVRALDAAHPSRSASGEGA